MDLWFVYKQGITWIHTKTRQRVVHDRRNTDIILDLKGGPALSQEKIPIIGGWTDYTGQGGRSTKSLMFYPAPDELFGTDAWWDGAREKQKGVLGEKIQYIRLRPKKEFIIFDKK